MIARANSLPPHLTLPDLPEGGVMDDALLPREHTAAERLLERTILASRYVLAPFYAGLGLSLLVLLIKFAQKTATLVANAVPSTSSAVIAGVLSLIDLALIASLVLMVMLACYENFISRFDLTGLSYKPSWMGHVDFGDLKLKLLTSIVAISAIHVLESFMSVGSASDRELVWSVGILIAFVVCALLLAIMNRLSMTDHHPR
jgi:uncharacterized protein (TIGR00645 family)